MRLKFFGLRFGARLEPQRRPFDVLENQNLVAVRVLDLRLADVVDRLEVGRPTLHGDLQQTELCVERGRCEVNLDRVDLHFQAVDDALAKAVLAGRLQREPIEVVRVLPEVLHGLHLDEHLV